MKTYTERDGSEFQDYANFSVEYRDASHRYFLHRDGERTPAVSVTSVLKVLDRPQLTKWLVAQAAAGEDAEEKRDVAAERGTAVHRVLELWATEEKVPNLADFPEDVRGYVQGLCRWLLTVRPVPSSVERFVASAEHGYAGRLDMRARIGKRDCIVDLKSNRGGRVYDEAHLQARAYAIADVECGSPEPDGVMIVAVGERGDFEVVECVARPEDWLSVLACYRSVGRLRSLRAQRRREQEAQAA